MACEPVIRIVIMFHHRYSIATFFAVMNHDFLTYNHFHHKSKHGEASPQYDLLHKGWPLVVVTPSLHWLANGDWENRTVTERWFVCRHGFVVQGATCAMIYDVLYDGSTLNKVSECKICHQQVGELGRPGRFQPVAAQPVIPRCGPAWPSMAHHGPQQAASWPHPSASYLCSKSRHPASWLMIGNMNHTK